MQSTTNNEGTINIVDIARIEAQTHSTLAWKARSRYLASETVSARAISFGEFVAHARAVAQYAVLDPSLRERYAKELNSLFREIGEDMDQERWYSLSGYEEKAEQEADNVELCSVLFGISERKRKLCNLYKQLLELAEEMDKLDLTEVRPYDNPLVYIFQRNIQGLTEESEALDKLIRERVEELIFEGRTAEEMIKHTLRKENPSAIDVEVKLHDDGTYSYMVYSAPKVGRGDSGAKISTFWQRFLDSNVVNKVLMLRSGQISDEWEMWMGRTNIVEMVRA